MFNTNFTLLKKQSFYTFCISIEAGNENTVAVECYNVQTNKIQHPKNCQNITNTRQSQHLPC